MSNDDDFGKHMAEKWGPEEVKEILETVSEKIPQLLDSLGNVLYSKENATKYGNAIASFYKSLLDAGMDQDQAFTLTEKYMSSLSPMSAIGGMLHKEGGGHGHGRKGSHHHNHE
jgi:hypothetical protein